METVWETTHLHVPHERRPRDGDLSTLMSVSDVDALLTGTYAAGQRRWDSVRLGKDGRLVPLDEFLVSRAGGFAEVDVPRVVAQYRDGASIILNNVQEAHPPVAELCNGLSTLFGVPAHANVYLTPPHSRGFPLHFDAHDVFLVQLAGAKRWNVYAPVVPLADARHQSETYDGPVDQPTRLLVRRGDVLYMPRGVPHEGLTDDEFSLHVTIGVTPYTWSQLLGDLVSLVSHEDVDLRRSVAPRLASVADGDVDVEGVLRGLVGRMAGKVGEVARRHVDDVVVRHRRDLRGELTHAVERYEIESDTTVRLATGVQPSVRQIGDRIALSFRDKVLDLPRFVAAHVELLCSGRETCADRLPPSVDDAGRLVLVRRLTREGLLEVVNGPAPQTRRSDISVSCRHSPGRHSDTTARLDSAAGDDRPTG